MTEFRDFLMHVGNWILLSAIPPLALFVYFYGVQSNWRSHRIGRALFWMTFSLLAVCGLSAITLLLGQDWLLRPYARILVFGFVSFTIWRMFFELRRIQKSSDDKINLEKEEM